jgi:hypothetical protein
MLKDDWNNLHQVRSKTTGITFIRSRSKSQRQKIGMADNLKVFESTKNKGSKQESQNQPRSPILEGGEL